VETIAWGWINMPKSLIFEKMLDLALPRLKTYRSDLFHDAQHINNLPDQIEKPVDFYYAIRETGTTILDERAFANLSTLPDFRYTHKVYRITVDCQESSKWLFGAVEV
jgi:hypothetical protein